MNHTIKRFLFRYYALIATVLFFASIPLFVFHILSWEGLAAVVAGAVTFAFSVQRQHLEEMRMFKELFQQFNERYDAQNEGLNQILRGDENTPLTDEERDRLFNYFNLCGEEYLYASQGLILPEVWDAWKLGMRYFRGSRRIKRLWDEELKSGSYYGLSFEDHDAA